MGYWDLPETKQKLREAHARFKPPKRKPNKKQIRLWRKLAIRNPNTSFEAMYQICFEFKKRYFNKSKDIKINALRNLNYKKMVNKIPYAKRREKKHYVLIGKKCWVCREKADIQHHIILIKNGGYDNGINRICICNNCHELIHEWMPIVRKEIAMNEELTQMISLENT